MRRKRLERFGPVEPDEVKKTPNSLVPGTARVSASAPEAEKDKKVEKLLVRCKHWPKCNKTDEQCEYVHPQEECKFFPKCSYGAKCMYVHPDVPCKYGDACTRYNCNYRHSKNHRESSNLLYSMKPWLMMAAQGMMQNP